MRSDLKLDNPLSPYSLPHMWKTPGDPSPAELAKSLRTAKLLLEQARESLNFDEGDIPENHLLVKKFECLLVNLYEYLHGE